jgi:hypothetical protein
MGQIVWNEGGIFHMLSTGNTWRQVTPIEIAQLAYFNAYEQKNRLARK